MSQAGIISTSLGPVPPEVPTSFVADVGGAAVPAANVLTVPGGTTTANNTNGIRTSASGSTLTMQLTNRITGSATTTDAVTPQTLYTFPMGATPGTYFFYIRVAAFNVTDSLSSAYSSYRCVRTDGVTGTLIGASTTFEMEEDTMTGVTVSNSISGNDAILTATGLAGKTINYIALTEYQLVT